MEATKTHATTDDNPWFLEQLQALTTRGTRVLLAEDHPEMRDLLAMRMFENGYEVTQVRNGLELLARLDLPFEAQGLWRQEKFDIIVSDNRMPGFSGLEVLATLRACDQTTPFVLITAFGDDLTHLEARDMGATAVLDKPFGIHDFLRLLSKMREGLPSIKAR